MVNVTGDGGLLFGIGELATAVQHRIGVVTVVVNNGAYGNVRRDQQTRYDGRIIAADLENPDFVKLAESFGAAGYRVDTPQALRPVLEQALADDAPAIIEIPMEKGTETSPWEFIMMKHKPGQAPPGEAPY